MNKDLKEKFGFTLAEVLITLGIIGIVSALTIPTLINNYKEKVRDNQFKKVYATLNQALRMTISDYDYIPKCYYPDTGAGAVKAECIDFYEKFRNKLRLSKICLNNSYTQGCIPSYKGVEIVMKENHQNDPDYDEEYWENVAMNQASGWSTNNLKRLSTSLVLSDSSIIIIYNNGTATNPSYFPLFLVDINGSKDPNKWGHDLFDIAIKLKSETNMFELVGNNRPVEEGGIQTTALIQKLFGVHIIRTGILK